MYDNLYGVQRYKMEYECGSLKRKSSVPLLSFYFYFSLFLFFWWPPWLFLFNSHLSSLGSFDFVLFGIFSSLSGQHSIYYKNYTRSFTFYKSTQHKENVTIMMQMYAS